MSLRSALMIAGAVLCAGLGSAQAQQSAMKQCAEKWDAAKAAGTTGGLTYLQFSSKCRADLKAGGGATAPAAPAAAAPAPAPVAAPAAPAAPAPVAAPAAPPVVAPKPAVVAPKPAVVAPKPAVAAPAPAAPVGAGTATFPAAVDPSFAALKAGDARRKTCSKGYQANKAAGSLGGLKWDQYYSQCNTRLKGGA
jgi:biotin carboxyl carrier protein